MIAAIDPRWAWDVYRPSSEHPWNLKKVGHLYRRAGFGASWSELQEGLKSGPEKTIERLLQGGPGQESFTIQTRGLADSIARTNNGALLAPWWLYRMLYTPHPLREKL